jgi:hypothetical protein
VTYIVLDSERHENAIAALIVVGEVWDEQVRRRLAEPVAPPAP